MRVIGAEDKRARWDLLQENLKLRDRVAHLQAELLVWANRVDDIAHDWHEAEAAWNKEREELKRGFDRSTDYPGGWAVNELTRCPSTYDGAKCYFTVGHSGNHLGVQPFREPHRVGWETDDEDDRSDPDQSR